MPLPSLLDEETTASSSSGRSHASDISWHDRIIASPAGRVGFGIVVVGLIGFAIFRLIGVANSNAPIYLDVRYMNPDTQEMAWGKVGQRMPAGFHPVEYCFQNTCGPEGGTPVVLNAYLGNPNTPTTCPKCGAPVVSHNPRPDEYLTAIPADWNN
ncbi:MAG: DUF1206 domain-containing protein [Phycisphaerales bacterium JB043]